MTKITGTERLVSGSSRGFMAFAALAAVLPVLAEVRLAAPFTDGMVLQRDRPVRVWGTADAGERVTVTFAGQTVETAADAKGDWLLELAPMAASKEGRVLTANGAEVNDVLVGEVWLCSGQSNCDVPVWGNSPRYRDGWGAMMLQSTVRPFVRLVKTPHLMSHVPVKDIRVEWKKMTPDLLRECRGGARMPSAMGYYYALELADELDVPVGIIDSSWGGSNIDSWTPSCGYDGKTGVDIEKNWKPVPAKEWKDGMRPKKTVINKAHKQPFVLWNGMIAAYVPMTVRGMIWYQGCTNSGEPGRYAAKMHALYDGWAKEFRNGDFRLYFAQLAPWGAPAIAAIQEAQAAFAAAEPNAAIAVINDVGNLHDIHPNDKRTVAKRLSLHALKRDYGYDWLRSESPTLVSAKVEGDRFVLSFRDVDQWYIYNPDGSEGTGFEICGEDGVWKKAEIVNLLRRKNRNGVMKFYGNIDGKDLIVRAEGVSDPKAVRYLHSEPWFGALYNEVCLPLGAFRTDK